MKEKIIQICYADGEINPTYLTDKGRVIKALPTTRTEKTSYYLEVDGNKSQQFCDVPVYEFIDITPSLELTNK